MNLRLVALTLLLLVVTAAPAAADPAGPTNYRSTVTGIEPAVDGLEVEVLGGDAFVAVTAPAGTQVEVAGYDGEPYLRLLADGTVERNEASPARWLNDARFGPLEVTVPPEASSDAPPRWAVVATGGTYAWHDHRVHWMSPEPPRHVDPSAAAAQPIHTWELTLVVDDRPVTVTGDLTWLPSPSPLVPATAGLLVVALGVGLVLRQPRLTSLVGLVGAAAAGTVGVAGSVGLPAGAEADPALLILPAAGALLAAVGWALRGRSGVGPPLVGALSTLPALVFGVVLSRALFSPIVPTALPDAAARTLVAVALGIGFVGVVAAGRTLLIEPPTTA